MRTRRTSGDWASFCASSCPEIIAHNWHWCFDNHEEFRMQSVASAGSRVAPSAGTYVLKPLN